MCAGNPQLRADVEALLKAHASDPGFLEQPAGSVGGTVDQARGPDDARAAETGGTEQPGAVLAGRYKLLEAIGEGGMGTVWMAQQTEPVKRVVAIKLIKAGLGSKTVLARFEAERQALALMDHPHIAKVLDAGATPDGRPFFAMELVKGMPITRYCDERRLNPRQRLELFVPVCQAVQHAHHKGVIHRDLKPSNVLVAQYDGKPVPKVIDFGVAKAAGQSLTEQTLVTGFGAIVGTLEYMSPEQAEINQLDIDTRSDVYALGVLLYELLTGSPPFSRKELENAGMLEMLRVIREQEPTRPSTKLSTAEGLPTLAANRGTEPAQLAKLVRGELDWIVMKALEKDRNRRYETANSLALDVQRYLADEAVQACPPSLRYRLEKFVRRHRAALATTAAALVMVCLLAGTFGWAVWDRATRYNDTAHEVSVALARTNELTEQARAIGGAASRDAEKALVLWRQAEDALGQAAAALSAGMADDDMRQRVTAARTEVEAGRLNAEHQLSRVRRRDKLFHDLDRARMARLMVTNQHFDHTGAATEFWAAFAAYGLDVVAGRTDELASRIAAEEPEVRETLLVALIEWANDAAAIDSAQICTPEKMRTIMHAADRDAWRQRYRVAMAANDPKKLRELAVEAMARPSSAANTDLLATDLERRGMRDEALALLRRGRARYPADFWLHFTLGSWLARASLERPRRRRRGSAARARRWRCVRMRASSTTISAPHSMRQASWTRRCCCSTRPSSLTPILPSPTPTSPTFSMPDTSSTRHSPNTRRPPTSIRRTLARTMGSAASGTPGSSWARPRTHTCRPSA